MKRCYISMTSLTYAQKAQKTLMTGNIPSEIVRLPQKYAQNGCAFGLAVNDRRTAGRATFVLDTSGIPYGKVIINDYE